MDDREKLRQRFNDAFGHWEIELPPEAMAPGVVWLIVQQGWTIWTRFDSDPDDGRKRLDYYSTHRMTNDRHIRLYADGDEEALPAIGHLALVTPPNATPAQEEAAKEEFFAHNQAVEKLLEEKGFVMTDDAHLSARVNRYLLTHRHVPGLR